MHKGLLDNVNVEDLVKMRKRRAKIIGRHHRRIFKGNLTSAAEKRIRANIERLQKEIDEIDERKEELRSEGLRKLTAQWAGA